MVGLYYADRFHTRVAQGNYKSRIKIYSLDISSGNIDPWSYSDVINHGVLLKYNPNDEDSNGRIGQGGIKVNNYFNKDEQIEIGNAACNNIEISLINDDNFFATYDWSNVIVIYWEVYEELNEGWLMCPIGCYWWERPTKTNVIKINAKANDAMFMLGNKIPGIVFPDKNDPRWVDGIHLYEFYNQIVNNIIGVNPDSGIQYIPNMDKLYHEAPFDASAMTVREVLAWMAGVCGGNAQIARDGSVSIVLFRDAYWREYPLGPKKYYTLGASVGQTPVTSIEIAEYTVPIIDKVIAMVGQTGKTFESGTGETAIYCVNNAFFVNTDAVSQAITDEILNVFSGGYEDYFHSVYAPMSLRAYFDPSVEGGDVIRVVYNGTTYLVPIFQQILYWNGAEWTADINNSGFETRRLPSELERQGFQSQAEINTTIKAAPTSAVVSNGVVSFKNAKGEETFTLQLPIPTVDSVTEIKPYLSRTIPYNTSIEMLNKIIGASVAWNQIVNPSKPATRSWSDFSITNNGDGTWTLNGTTTARITSAYATVSTYPNHVFYVSAEYLQIRVGSDSLAYYESETETIIKPSDTPIDIRFRVESGVTLSNHDVRPQMIDLTWLFGPSIAEYIYTLEQANQGAGVSWFKSFFASYFYDSYDARSLLSVQTNAHVLTDSSYSEISSYPLDGTIELRGIVKLDSNNNIVYDGDEYYPDGTIIRKFGIRAFQSGDTTDGVDTVTDGTNTVYRLSIPTTETAAPYTQAQFSAKNGTEYFEDERTVKMPVGNETAYIVTSY